MRRHDRSKMWLAVGMFCMALALLGCSGAALANEGKVPLVVTTGNLAVKLSPQGELVGMALGAKQIWQASTGGTRLSGCKAVGDVIAQPLPDGGVRFSRKFVSGVEGHTATVVESFRPATDSIRWEIEIIGGDTPWSVPIQTWLKWPEPTAAKWWTSWSDPRPGGGYDWEDPLMTSPFVDRTLSYAGVVGSADSIGIPLVSVLDAAGQHGLTLVLSPEDLVLVMNLVVNRDGRMVFSRKNHRIQAGHPIRFAMDLVAHTADTRGGLDWMVRRYPDYFNPPNPTVHEFSGCAGFSTHADITTPKHLHRMAFRMNWKGAFDLMYMSMFFPPEDEWIDIKFRPNSLAGMRAYVLEMNRLGFHVLGYFNVTEAGAFHKWPPPPRKAASDADLWRDSNDYLFYRLGDAILLDEHDKPIGSWEGCVGMDAGEPVFHDHLIEQARRQIDKLPEVSGICIDRADWIRKFNRHRDDGVSWVDGAPARSLAVSWHAISKELSEMMHGAGKVIYTNISRTSNIGWLKHADGIYDEYGDDPIHGNRSALMALRKPVMNWTRSAWAVRKNPDAYFQRHLYLGSYLTAPLPGNDHSILPEADIDQFFLDYGPLLDAMRGKRWYLRPNTIEATGAKVNLFEVPGGYAMPVTFGQADRATVTLHGLPQLSGQNGFRVEVIHPGQTEWKPLPTGGSSDRLVLNVPLVRGCAMVKLAYAWMDPKTTFFAERTTVRLGTTLRDAVMRYTVDGSMPSATSARYEEPVVLEQSSKVRAAAFRGDERIGEVMTADYFDPPIDSPAYSPIRGGFDESLEVTLSPLPGIPNDAIYYTLDGSVPTADSIRYTGPIKLTETTTIRSAVCLPGRDSCVGEVTFHHRNPKPPMPDVFLSNLTPVSVNQKWLKKLSRVDRAFSIYPQLVNGTPLSIAGTTYARGISHFAPAELVFKLKPDYRRFVSVVGIDDAKKNRPTATVTFEVWIDDKRVEETRVLRPGDYEYINVAIPAGSRRIRLITTHADDGEKCDHADWAASGFLQHYE